MRRPILSVVAILILSLLVISPSQAGGKRVTSFLPFSDPLEIEKLQNLIHIFEANNPDIKADLRFELSYEQEPALRMWAVSGRSPDVFALDVFHAPFIRHIAQPLDEFWEKDPIRDNFDPRLIEIFRFYGDRKLYGIPRSFDSLGLFYNRELFDLAGLSSPKNWNDLRQAVAKMTKKGADRYGITFGDATVSFLALAIANGAAPLIEDNKNEALINVGSDEAIEALKSYLELQTNFPSPPWSIGAEGVKQAFINGRVAMIFEGSWCTHYFRQTNLNYDIARLPSIHPEGRGKLLFATVYSISNQTKVPDESWKLVKFLIGKDSQNLWLESSIGLPFHKAVANFFLEHYPVNEAFYKDMDVAKLYSFDRIGTLYVPELERAIKKATMGERSPDEALQHAAIQIKHALKEIYE